MAVLYLHDYGVTPTRKCFTQGMQKSIFALLLYNSYFNQNECYAGGLAECDFLNLLEYLAMYATSN